MGLYLFTGTYTKGKSKGIYTYRFDANDGSISPCASCKVSNPSYIAFCPVNGHVYSVSENETGRSYVNAFAFDTSSGQLTLLNRRVTGGEGTCHIAVDPHGKFAVASNYGGGSLSVFPIDSAGTFRPLSQNIRFKGKSANRKRQDAPHLHCTVFSPDGKYLFATDLGTDKIYRFDIDYTARKFIPEASRKEFDMQPGKGPRHLIFHPNGKYLYIVNELSGTVMVFTYKKGEIEAVQEVPIGDEPQQGGGAIAISADGKRLFVSLREGNDGVAAYGIGRNGRIVREGFYSTRLHPRDICLAPDGKHLVVAAMEDNVVEVWKVLKNGRLSKQTKLLEDIDTPAFVALAELG